MVEALAEHLRGAQHGDEGVEVLLVDEGLQLACLPVGEGGVDHVMGLVGVSAEAGGVGGAAHQLFHDEIADGVLVVADDEDGLAHLHLLQHRVDDQRFHGEAHEGIQGGVQVEDEARRQHHDQIGDEGIKELGCPAIVLNNGNVCIDSSMCTGCGLCSQVCPVTAITGGEDHE